MMNSKRITKLRIFGFCGTIAPFVAFTCILLAIAFAPHFSWTDNALSDLGVVSGFTSFLFNLGLIVSGGLTLFFAVGMSIFFGSSLSGRVGTSILALDSLALIAVGIFPEKARPMHLYASVTFFVLFPLSMLFLAASFLLASNVSNGLFTLSTAIFNAAVWLTQFSFRYAPGEAIPETLSALSASLWAVVIGFEMTRGGSCSGE
jgi:hypothetical membrane protein